MKRIGILTSSRADFGIYLPLLKELKADKYFHLEIIAFGTHLSHFHGYTLDQITQEGFTVKYNIESMLQSDSVDAISTAIGLTTIKFSSFWQQHAKDFDIVFSIGDRYEMFAAVVAGISFGVTFAHIHGGETSLGSIDNIFRHCLTQICTYHFASAEPYMQRIIGMIGNDEYVFNVGALGLDNLSAIALLNITQFHDEWAINLGLPTILLTFHPETVNPENNLSLVTEITDTIRLLPEYQFLITMPNADTSGTIIRKAFETVAGERNGIFLVENLGTQSYFSAMKHCAIMLGNTSSGIIEAASFGKYVINIGHRQKGRLHSSNVIHVPIAKTALLAAIQQIEAKPKTVFHNIYDNGGAAKQIIKILKEV